MLVRKQARVFTHNFIAKWRLGNLFFKNLFNKMKGTENLIENFVKEMKDV